MQNVSAGSGRGCVLAAAVLRQTQDLENEWAPLPRGGKPSRQKTAHHRSRASLQTRRCVASALRSIARSMPIFANSIGPRFSAASISI
jgi:hypothetical protein